MKDIIWVWLCLILICLGCGKSIDKYIRKSVFQSIENPHKVQGNDKIIFGKDNFEFKYERRIIPTSYDAISNAEPNIKGYSGTYRVDSEILILDIKQVLCCIEAIESKAEQLNNKMNNKIYGLRFVSCKYKNYNVDYLDSINFNYKLVCKDSFLLKYTTSGILFIDEKMEYEKKR